MSDTHGVGGSSPSAWTNFAGSVAQLAEQLTLNQWVVGSIPAAPTIYGPLVKFGITPPSHGGVRGSNPHVSTICVFLFRIWASTGETVHRL